MHTLCYSVDQHLSYVFANILSICVERFLRANDKLSHRKMFFYIHRLCVWLTTVFKMHTKKERWLWATASRFLFIYIYATGDSIDSDDNKKKHLTDQTNLMRTERKIFTSGNLISESDAISWFAQKRYLDRCHRVSLQCGSWMFEKCKTHAPIEIAIAVKMMNLCCNIEAIS